MKSVFPSLLLVLASALPSLGSPCASLTVGEGFVNPLGYHDASPVFSWRLPQGVNRQTAYRIETESDGLRWDSGWVSSENSTFVPYGGAPLKSRQRLKWRVNFRDEKQQEAGWSETARLELGLLSASDWKAQWIRAAGDEVSKLETVDWLRRNFDATKPIAQARLHVAARGLFVLRLNGERVGRDHFANGFTPYDTRLDALTYDVTGQLKTGANTLEAMLGAGWYAGRLPFERAKKGPYGPHPELLLQLELTYTDGSGETIVSDGQWEGTREGPVLSSSIYDGETYDARRTSAQWQPVATQPALGTARISPKPFAPVREVQTLATQSISEPQPGHFVFDLGQNMVGWARIKVPVEKDQTLTLHFAEMLRQDGTLYTENYRSAKSTDTYTAARTGTVEWEPSFTFHGFRYVELTGLPAGAKPQKDWVTGVVLGSDLRRSGRFESSHAKLNQLQSNIEWGWRGNSLDIPTDCPQRDERMGWTGDAQAFCGTALLNTDCLAFWKSWLASMRDEQDADGSIPAFIPTARNAWKALSPGWMDAATIIPWELYQKTGDKEVLEENFVMMERLVGWYRSQSSGGLLPNIGGYGDWLQPHAKAMATKQDHMGDRRGDTPRPLLGSVFYAHSARILADSAKALGRTEEANRYAAEADTVRDAFFSHYFDVEGRVQNAPETQTAYVLALAFNLVPIDFRPKLAAHLVDLVKEADGHLRTGFLGTPYLVKVLDDTGHQDLAYSVLLKETYPSWFYSINQGATTMWERWNSYTRDHGFGDVAMNSFNHYAYGAIGQWMYERVAGIASDPAHPGYKHFFVRPLVKGPLSSARAEVETPYGKAVSSWEKRNGKVTLMVTIPPNTTATVDLRGLGATRTLAPGTHTLECPAE